MLTFEQRALLLPKAFNAAVRAGKAILDIYDEGAENWFVELKTDNSPLTEADRNAHMVIKNYLSPTHIPLLSEEGREMFYEERRGWDLFWLVDPLDGTKEFLRRNGEFTVNIALMSDNVPVIGVIYIPVLKKIYFGDIISGSFCRSGVEPDSEAEYELNSIYDTADSIPLYSGPNDPVKVAVSRSHITDDTTALLNDLQNKYPGLEIIRQGSSYKFCLLAEGSVDYYVRTTHTMEWDTAAGELILKLAGGETRSLTDLKPLKYNESSLFNPWFECRSPNFTFPG